MKENTVSEYWRLVGDPRLLGMPDPTGLRGVPRGRKFQTDDEPYPTPYSSTPATLLGKPTHVEPYGGAGLTSPAKLEEARQQAGEEDVNRRRQQALKLSDVFRCSVCGGFYLSEHDCNK